MLWSLALLAGYLALRRPAAQAEKSYAGAMHVLSCVAPATQNDSHHIRNISPAAGILIVCAAALLARAIPVLVDPAQSNYDIASYQIVGGLVLQDENVYTSPQAENRYPYLPLQMYWSAFTAWSASQLQAPFAALARLAPIAADVAIAALIFTVVQRSATQASRTSPTALWAGLAYAANPIPVFVSAYQGQFDSIPILCIMLSWWALERSNGAYSSRGARLAPAKLAPTIPAKSYPALSAGIWLGLGILTKSWPILALPSIFKQIPAWSKRWQFSIAVAIPALLAIGFYSGLVGANPLAILERALSYNRGVGIWGTTYFFRLLSLASDSPGVWLYWLSNLGRWSTLAILSGVWWFKARRQPTLHGILIVLAAFLAFTHAFAIQYLVWIIPFAIVDSALTLPNQQDRWLRHYTLAAFAYMFLAYNTLILRQTITNLLPWPQADWFLIIPAGLPAWLVCVGWTASLLRSPIHQTPAMPPVVSPTVL